MTVPSTARGLARQDLMPPFVLAAVLFAISRAALIWLNHYTHVITPGGYEAVYLVTGAASFVASVYFLAVLLAKVEAIYRALHTGEPAHHVTSTDSPSPASRP